MRQLCRLFGSSLVVCAIAAFGALAQKDSIDQTATPQSTAELKATASPENPDYAVLGEFEKQLNNFQAAIDNFRKALELTELTSEQLFLSKRLRDSEERDLCSVA